MPAEDEEVAVEVLHVDRHMHRALAAVDQHRNAARMGDLAYNGVAAFHVRTAVPAGVDIEIKL